MPTTTKDSPATGIICLFGIIAVVVMLFPSCQAVMHGVGKTYRAVGMLSDWHTDEGTAVRDYDTRFVRSYETAQTEEDVAAVKARVNAWSDNYVWYSLRDRMARYDYSIQTEALNRINRRQVTTTGEGRCGLMDLTELYFASELENL